MSRNDGLGVKDWTWEDLWGEGAPWGPRPWWILREYQAPRDGGVACASDHSLYSEAFPLSPEGGCLKQLMRDEEWRVAEFWQRPVLLPTWVYLCSPARRKKERKRG